MRLTLSTLPQLAVLAKILCLLMVVMCGAVPTMVRSVNLYSACSSEYITVQGREVTTEAKTTDFEPFQNLTTISEDFSKKIYIYAECAQRYICFSRKWKVVALKNKTGRCQFYENYTGSYLMYRSAVSGKHIFLGFNKHGVPMNNQNGSQNCYNFLKIISQSSENPIIRHNKMVSGNNNVDNGKITFTVDTGVSPKRHSVNTRKGVGPRRHRQHKRHRGKKNFLQADEAPRGTMITRTPHHHRHSNRLNQPHEKVLSPRRRHHQSRTLEASKY